MNKFIKSITIVIVSYIFIRFIKYITKKIFDITRFDVQYERTVISIIVSISYYLSFFTACILILKEYGIIDFNQSTILTGAGLFGLVAGFASQSLIKDILNGFFILFEKQMKVGDYVLINERFRGTVEEIGLRSISIRDWDLRRISLPNGEIKSIMNYSRKKMRVIIHVRVSYESDPNLVIQALEEVCVILNEKYKEFLVKNMMKEPSNPFKVYGVTDIYKDSIGAQYTITGVVEPFKYWSISKDARLNILLKFKEKGIKIAYPKRVNINLDEYDNYL
ncbi:mechanosensitive ion channel family protein [Tepidibacter formicigenes]|uniref:Small conductance mechanosensitive channel n=1 Tax=Tepidibacter formicigenes DSM 15518 TaxID=1123349 RepID=A0A1M6LBV1_9FIRM|nr:mechanosensitive ion channel family protein [Tepidibacter formicigenes]SHJ68710.1 small conductance mechanosensitive channel [Tepidibacter formicigenes DSM 15518]